MMTSFAFILGLYPLVVASGASELARRNVGSPVFGGMILASFVGIFAIPPLYVIFQAHARKSPTVAAAEERGGADMPGSHYAGSGVCGSGLIKRRPRVASGPSLSGTTTRAQGDCCTIGHRS